MVSLEEDLHWAQWPWASVCQPVPSPRCAEAQAFPGTLVSCTELCELFCQSGTHPLPPALSGIGSDGFSGGPLPSESDPWSTPFLKPCRGDSGPVSSSTQVGSLALTNIVSSDTQDIPLALTGIDGETGGRFALGLLFLGQCQSVRFPGPSVLKLRPFLAPSAPALSWDGDPGGRLVSDPQAPGPSDRCSAPSALKLGPILAPWCPALSCVSFSTQVGPLELTNIVSSSTQEGPLTLTGIDGETGGSLALGLLFLGQWPSAWCPAPNVLKLRPFLAPWSPALSCVSSSAQMVSLEEDLCWAPTGPRPVSVSLVLIPRCAEAQILPGTLVSCTELCELFLPGGPPGLDWHSELFCPGEAHGLMRHRW
nr:uncharacterized protein LOC129013542 isoform X2 [Pongo pygmaeus]